MDTGNTTPAKDSAPNVWAGLIQRLENELSIIQKDETTVLRRAAKSLQCATDSYRHLHAVIEKYVFQEAEEVLFYKKIKPVFISQIVFNSRLLTIEKNRPPATPARLEQYYTQELEKLNAIYSDHRFIQQYLESSATYLDEKLFFRPGPETTIALIGLEPPPDGAFQVCYDHAVGQLLGADLLKQHLLEALRNLLYPGHSAGDVPRITWTAPNVHLVELAYMLRAAGVFNNGKASIKDIVVCLENAFNAKTNNHSRQMQEILYRHSGPTVFIDSAKNAYLLYIKNIDERQRS